LTQNEDARKILQSVLDNGAQALLDGDPEPFFQHVYFPHVIVTEDEETLATSRDDLIARFNSVSNALKANGVTDYVRLAHDCRFKDDGSICGHWKTHIIRRDHRLVPPFPCRTRMIEVDGIWQMTHAIYGLRFAPLPDRFPLIADDPRLPELQGQL
jgi:hypothetical protein